MYKILIPLLMIPILAFAAINPTDGITAGENKKCIGTADAKNLKNVKFGRTEVNKGKSNVKGSEGTPINMECPPSKCKGPTHPDPGEQNVNNGTVKNIPERICCEKIIKGQCAGKEKYNKIADKPMEFAQNVDQEKQAQREAEAKALADKINNAPKRVPNLSREIQSQLPGDILRENNNNNTFFRIPGSKETPF